MIAIPAALGAIALFTLVSARGGDKVVSAPPSAMPLHTLNVVSFTATALTPAEVRLDWSAAGAGIEEFVIYRNGGVLLTIRTPGTTTFTDRTVSPNQDYEYELMVVGTGSSTDRITTLVTTPPPPPLTEARLEGAWSVRTTYVGGNAPNLDVGDRGREEWVFHAQCDEGACKVRAVLYYKDQRRTILLRKGRTYGGKGVANYHRCERIAHRTTLDISIKVTKGVYYLGVWRADVFTGSITTTSPGALGCGPGEVTRSLRGTFEP